MKSAAFGGKLLLGDCDCTGMPTFSNTCNRYRNKFAFSPSPHVLSYVTIFCYDAFMKALLDTGVNLSFAAQDSWEEVWLEVEMR